MVGTTFGSMHSALHSTAMSAALNALILLAVVVWLGLGFRVYRDARRRVGDSWLVGLSSLLGFGIPFVGPIVYTLFRPPETLADVRAREVEMQALRGRLLQVAPRCPVCMSEVESDYLVCPVCTTRLRERCHACDSPLDRLWQACPYCATPVTAAVPTNGAGIPFPADLDAALRAETQQLATD